ncbi:hemicentin-1-like isoform X2 [Mya arenaria]|uniref:hemicentin-1-like isoform X2 n=2 Tax=Mya arenaria TaxID=6604 RepID=UPI0022E1FF4C|nr:hemicentin-1-like isoform X2 [Mya arenaria]
MDMSFGLFLYLVSVWIIAQMMSSTCAFTISGNGTGTEGASVHLGENLELTCNSLKDDISSVQWYKKPSGSSDYPTKYSVAMQMNSNKECVYDFPAPDNMKCVCVSKTKYTCTLISVQMDMNDDMWMCNFIYGNDDNASAKTTSALTITVTGETKFGITSVTISPSGIHRMSVIANKDGIFQCNTSSGKPLAKIEWYKHKKTSATGDDTIITSGIQTTSSTATGDLVVAHETLTLPVRREDQDMGVYCRAKNAGQWLTSRIIEINVLYGPDTPVCTSNNINVSSLMRVIVGSTFSIFCTADSEPSPSRYVLSGPGVNNTELQLTGIKRIQAGSYTVEVSNNMSATGSESPVTGRNSSKFNIDILYTPSVPTIRVDGKAVQGTVKIIEGNSKVFNCSTESNPASNYSWTYPRGSGSNSVLQVNDFKHGPDDGVYTCTAQNRLEPSFGSFKNGLNMTTITVNVLYGPKVITLQDNSVVRGKKFEYRCLYEPGNSSSMSFEWTRSGTTAHWTNQITQNLTIPNVQRSDEANYTCKVSGVLEEPLTLETMVKNDTATFHLDVMYGAEKVQLLLNNNLSTPVEIEENSTNNLLCLVEGNPAPHMFIAKDGKTILERPEVNQLTHVMKAECSDTGVYNCSGYNQYGTADNASVRLFVKCSARQPPGVDVKLNYIARQHANVTLSFTIVAYPVPEPSDFVWKMCNNESEGFCKPLEDNIHRFDIKTESLSSSLTIRNVTTEDYGIYQFSVSNNIGTRLIEWLHLKPIGKPNLPTDFHVIQEEIRETSVVLTWVPGFDNGSPQTFYITYGKKRDSSKRITKSIKHKNEAEMNYTLRNLETETEYIASINASNESGYSQAINDTFITMKHITGEQKSLPVALIGGVVGGGVVAVLVLIGVIFIVNKFRTSGYAKNREKIRDDREMSQLSSPQQDDDDVVENEMYVPAGDMPQRKGNESRSDKNMAKAVEELYAQPQKTTTLQSLNSDIYAEVKKDKGKGITKTGHKKQYDNKSFEDDTNENHDFPDTKKNENKGGLIYADVHLANTPKGRKRLVVHGLDDKTEYAEVDLTKKVDPLPKSEEGKSD